MLQRTILVITASLASCTSVPKVTVAFDPVIHHVTKTQKLRSGDLRLNRRPPIFAAEYPAMVFTGWWGLKEREWPHGNHFRVEVVRLDCQTIAKQIDELDGRNGSYLSFGSRLNRISVYGRFARRTFSWGPGVSFTSQRTQDGPESPDIGHMLYEVWGCTHDKKHLVHLSVSLTHPTWPEWTDAKIRSYKNMPQSVIDRDPDVIRLRSLPSNSFVPSLDAVDRLADTIKLRR